MTRPLHVTTEAFCHNKLVGQFSSCVPCKHSETAPDGPTTLHELFDFARETCSTLSSSVDMKQTLHDNLTAGVSVRTHYSGLLTPEIAAHALASEMGVPPASITCQHSCDSARECIKLVRGWTPSDTAPQHSFIDFTTRIPVSLAQGVSELEKKAHEYCHLKKFGAAAHAHRELAEFLKADVEND
jgi:hypothetical protein